MVDLTLHTELPSRTKNTLNAIIPTLTGMHFSVGNIVNTKDDIAVSDSGYAVNNAAFFNAVREAMILHEGKRNKAYVDTANKRTIGIGFNMAQWGTSEEALRNNLKPILEAIGVADWLAVYNAKEDLSDKQVEELFRITMTGRNSAGKQIMQWQDVTAVKLHHQLTTGTDALDASKKISGEQLAALISLAYNVPTLVGSGVRGALLRNDMAAATYEVLRNSNLTEKDGSLRAGVHGLANRRLAEAALFTGNANLTLPDAELWQIVGWARKSIANGKDPNTGGVISRDTPINFRLHGRFPDFFDVPPSPPEGRITPNASAGEDWNIVYALRQGDVPTKLHRVNEAGVTVQTARLATHKGEIIMGTEGDDILIGGEGNNAILGGPDWGSLERNVGNDIIIGGQGEENNLFGGSGNNTIVGGYAANFLYAGGGTNKLTGGKGKPNMFHVARPAHVAPTPFTNTTITDFRPGIDYLSMDHIYGMEELSIQDDPANNKTVISYRDNHTLHLEGVRARQLSRRDFNLIAIDPKPVWPPTSLKMDKDTAPKGWADKFAITEKPAMQR